MENVIKVKVKRFDSEIPLPEYKTAGAAAFDFHARREIVIPPHEIGYVPLNVALEVPKDCFLMLVARSSTHKRGLWMANGIGVIDADFSGNEDEIRAAYYNFTDTSVTIEKGERIAQGVIMKRDIVTWHEVENMENKTRGGFGTTGAK